jgi:3-deoxy-manno-octulosonate cytidylyltransferase (CMP-KDO synthetase)
MKIIGLIPVRMAASRYPGKPMASILGLPMIGHCYYRTKLVNGLDAVYVATCDKTITHFIESIGGKSVMTSSDHNRATSRTAEALEIIEHQLGTNFDVVVMVQGDEPLITPEAIEKVLPHFDDPDVDIVNIMSRFKTIESFRDENNVKVVFDQNFNALYFSREPIPSPWRGWDNFPRYMQTGIIAFRRDALLKFNETPETITEKIESVDMNRVLEMGKKIRMVPINDFTLGVDTPEELSIAEKYLTNDPTLIRYMKS